ncbi:hypothetical protein [Nonomuraea sp. LPB2021202275-12-8]|uniref:hypothetical protein n=1 Tax=Nonomuraea sp. LPB2021202275-12-8 TaxID=3120159 RepID=UPI00300D9D9A
MRTQPPAPPAQAPPGRPARPARPVRRGVPGRIRVLTGVAAAALALLFAAIAAGTSTAGDGLRVIGRDSGPQVVATAGLYFGLSDMDAQIADVLVMGGENGARRQAAIARYEQQRSMANQALLKAFELAGDDQAERRTIESVLDGLGRYEGLAAQALLLDSQSGHPAGPPPAEVVRVYRQATDLMRQTLLPQAYNLTLESSTIVRRTYDDKTATLPFLRWAVVVAGLLALVCLLRLQVYLARHFRRVFGLALVAATVVTLVALVAGVSVLRQDLDHLQTAKSEGFDSVVTLARARAIGNSMQGDQSRFLLDRERADTYEHTYLDKSQKVLYLEAGNLDTYHDKVAQKSGDYLGMLGLQLSGKTGRPALDAYARFQAADTTFRQLVAEGKAGEAVSARLGPVREAFDAYDKELVALADRHEAVFERAVGEGESALDGLWRLIPFAMGGIGLLLLAGVWPRLREYR